MRRFFLVAPFVFLLGIGLPLLAANTGGEKHVCTNEQTVSQQDSISHHQCAGKAEEESTQLQSSPFLPIPGLSPDAQQRVAPHGNDGYQKVPPGSPLISPEKIENNAGKPVPTFVGPAKSPEKKKETSSDVVSFNFLYYLFYKFSLNEFF